MNYEKIKDLLDNMNYDTRAKLALMSLTKDEVPLLIQDNGKLYWQRAVDIIKNISYPKNKLAIPKLLWLFQDMNWPGVLTALEVLENIKVKELIPYIEEALLEAYNQEDYMWIGGIQRIVDKLNIKSDDFKNKDTFNLLKLSDW